MTKIYIYKDARALIIVVHTKKRLKQSNLHHAKYKQEMQTQLTDALGSNWNQQNPSQGPLDPPRARWGRPRHL